MSTSERDSERAGGSSQPIPGHVTNHPSIQPAPGQSAAPQRKPHRLSVLFRGLRRWLASKIVQDVPEDSALCEFDCERGQCTHQEWATCDRRINKAAGELWPAAPTPPSQPPPPTADSPSRPSENI